MVHWKIFYHFIIFGFKIEKKTTFFEEIRVLIVSIPDLCTLHFLSAMILFIFFK